MLPIQNKLVQKALNASQVPGTSELGKPAFEEHLSSLWAWAPIERQAPKGSLYLFHSAPHNHPELGPMLLGEIKWHP